MSNLPDFFTEIRDNFCGSDFTDSQFSEGLLAQTGIKPKLTYREETFTYDQMTDGGSTSATIQLASLVIPAGATVLRAKVHDVTGFAGDTSATIQVGDGTDADRYSTGTPSVFADTDDATIGVPSGVQEHAVTKTVTVTITSGADWGSVTAGQATVGLLWLEL